jgi:hypothetical protein
VAPAIALTAIRTIDATSFPPLEYFISSPF